jgi:hypothetical protein
MTSISLRVWGSPGESSLLLEGDGPVGACTYINNFLLVFGFDLAGIGRCIAAQEVYDLK